MLELKGKKILLFIPNFFGYELDIKNELESLGAKVFYFDARPKNDFITKVFIRLNLKKMIQKKIDKYYQNMVVRGAISSFSGYINHKAMFTSTTTEQAVEAAYRMLIKALN